MNLGGAEKTVKVTERDDTANMDVLRIPVSLQGKGETKESQWNRIIDGLSGTRVEKKI